MAVVPCKPNGLTHLLEMITSHVQFDLQIWLGQFIATLPNKNFHGQLGQQIWQGQLILPNENFSPLGPLTPLSQK